METPKTLIADLIIPKEYKKDVNPLSGYLNYGTKNYNKTLRTLFLMQPNIEYLQKETFSMITFKPYITQVLENSLEVDDMQINLIDIMIEEFSSKSETLNGFIEDRVLTYDMPKPEEQLQLNVIMQLHYLNRDFILDLSKNIILTPTMLVKDFNDINPETQKRDVVEWGYGPASYSDGTWHPEHLFTRNKKNDKTAYWKPLSVTFDVSPPGAIFKPREPYYGLNTRDEREKKSGREVIYRQHRGYLPTKEYSPGPGPGNKYAYASYSKEGFKSTRGMFPRWQNTMQAIKMIKKDAVDEGLRGGGRSDRRVQSTRSIDMRALRYKPHY